MTKPKIAIALDEMSVGGIPVACLSFLDILKDRADVTMILERAYGVFTNKIPDGVRVIVKPSDSVTTTLKKLIKKGKLFTCLFGLAKFFWYSRTDHWIRASAAVCNCRETLLDEEFDCAIAYHGMSGNQMNRLLANVKAKKKIAWIHGDHSFERKHLKDAEWLYNRFDHIFCVSGVTKEKYLKDFPSLKDKTDIYYNHMPVNDIIERSLLPMDVDLSTECTNIVTVGRVSPEKGQDLIPSVARLLCEKGYSFHWYVVGDGPDRQRIEGLIKEAKVDDTVIMLGNKTNPYPYIKACDIYVQPSYTEGFPLTIFEASILSKAIVATNVGGTKEKLCDGEEAIFVEPTAESIAAGIEKLLNDTALCENIKKNLSKRDFSNKEEVEKLLNLIEDKEI